MSDPRYDFDKETDKDFLREAGKLLQERVIELEVEKIQLKIQHNLDEEIKKKLTGELLVLRKRIFDTKQEKNKKKKKLRKKKKKKGNLPHNENENKTDLENSSDNEINLESVDVEHEIDDNHCPNCGKEKLSELENLFEESTEYDVKTTFYILKRHKRKKYKCQCCDKIVTADGPPKLVPQSKFSIEMALKLVCDKFMYHLPLERQRQIMKRKGVDVSVKTLFTITQHLYNLLYPINELSRQDIINFGNYVGIDESTMKFFNPNKANGQVWSMSNNLGAYYQFEPTRSGEIAKELIKGYQGVVITDGYVGYSFLKTLSTIVHAYCWSHLRRYFFDALVENDKAGEVVDMVDQLYEIEHDALNIDDLEYLRKTRSSIIFKEIVQWMDDNESSYLPSTLTGKAIKYFYNQQSGLSKFLENKYVPLDNNGAERRQRCPVMGRKNYLFFRSIDGADIGMFFYSIIESCKTNGIDPSSYMLEMAIRSIKSEELESPYQYATKLRNSVIKDLKRETELLKENINNSS